jgi:hypothetical protein
VIVRLNLCFPHAPPKNIHFSCIKRHYSHAHFTYPKEWEQKKEEEEAWLIGYVSNSLQYIRGGDLARLIEFVLRKLILILTYKAITRIEIFRKERKLVFINTRIKLLSDLT